MSITLPSTWKLCKNVKINQIYDEVYEEARSLGLLSKHHHKRPLYINKSVRFWGLCRWRKESVDVYDCAVCLNEKIVQAESYDAARKVLVHEVAHIAAPGKHHSDAWYYAGNRIGRKWNITVHRTDSYEGIELKGEEEAKYIVECPKCHHQWKYSRMCKTVEKYNRYRCTSCQEYLIRVK
jgi:predicted SprT family Zn-dependent metalloprotease